MLSNILKSAFRNIEKRKFNTILSILGLTLGFSSFIIISLFIKYELSWDSYQENYERIYRIQTYKTVDDEQVMQTSPALSAFIRDKYSDIENQAIVHPDQIVYLSLSENDLLVEVNGLYADQGYLDIFSFDFKYGDKGIALVEPLSIALSSSLSNTLFKNEDPVGKSLLLDKKHNLKVTGVYEDLPKNSHLRPEYIISINSREKIWNTNTFFEQWDNNAYFTYVLLKEGSNHETVNAEVKELLKERVTTDYRQLYLQQLSKLYMYSTNNNYLIIMYMLGVFSIFVLALAAINYTNLSIASSALRAKEIGIKKVIGSSRTQLMLQVFIETFLITIFSLFLSLIFVELTLNAFNQFMDKSLTFSLLFQNGFYLIILSIILLVAISSSFYPAWLITSVNSIDLFNKKLFQHKRNRIPLKKTLVGFQFTVAIFLITLTVLMTKQISYTQTKDVGFNKSDLLFAELNADGVTLSQIQNRFGSVPEIQSISCSRGFPMHSSKYIGANMVNWEGGARDEVTEVRYFWVSYDFIKTLDLEILGGRGFSVEYPGDVAGSCLINETAAQHFGWDDPIGKYLDDRKLQVVGLIKDLHFHDMYNTIKPMVLTLQDDHTEIGGPVFFAFRIDGGSEKVVAGKINKVLKEFYPNDPFEVKLFTDHFATESIFKIYDTFNSIFIFFAFIAIILSVLGVFGLVTHSLNQKTKEIAIRKISGCSSFAMFRKITLEYIIMIAIASVIGSVAARYIFNTMPINYPIEQTIFDFLIAIVIATAITLLSIVYKTWKESTRNPVEALRYE